MTQKNIICGKKWSNRCVQALRGRRRGRGRRGRRRTLKLLPVHLHGKIFLTFCAEEEKSGKNLIKNSQFFCQNRRVNLVFFYVRIISSLVCIFYATKTQKERKYSIYIYLYFYHCNYYTAQNTCVWCVRYNILVISTADREFFYHIMGYRDSEAQVLPTCTKNLIFFVQTLFYVK